jgi:hypothetical protein
MRLRSVVVAAVAALGVVVPSTGAAAAGPCSIVAPTKVVLDQSYLEVPFKLASNCSAAGREYASWNVINPSQGASDILIFDTNTVDYWDIYDWSDGPARYTVRPSSGWDSNFDDLTQNTAYVTVKLGSRLTATTTRANGLLTFSAYARTYSPSLSDWYKRAGASVAMFYQAPGSSTWSYVKSATTSSSGRVTMSVAPKYGSYRLMIKETDRVWASYSSTVRGK